MCAVLSFCLVSCDLQKDQNKQEIKPAPPFYALSDIKEGRKNIYLIVKSLDSSYWNVVIDGAKDASDDFDCNVYCSGSYVESDWESQSNLLDDAMEANADAVLIAPCDSVKLSNKIEQVYSNGINVLFIDTAANTERYDVSYMTDNLMAGQNAAEEMLRQLKAVGNREDEALKVGIQIGVVSSQTINERLAGFLQYWSRNAPKDWEVVSDIKCNDGDIEKGVTMTKELLENDPDIKGVFGSNNGSTVALARVIKEEGRTDVVVVGFDYSEEIAGLIASDEYTASSMLQRQYFMSYTGIETALKLIDGGKVENKFIDMGVVAVNRDNLDTPEIEEVLNHNK